MPERKIRVVIAKPPGSPPNANGVVKNHVKHILEKRDGAWKLLSAQNTFIAAN